MAIWFFTCNFWSIQAVFGLTDKQIRDALMIEPINHTGIISIPSSYTTVQSNPVEHNDSNVKRDIAKSSSKYILENNKIVFERYDQNGKLISRVPWSAHKVSAKV